MSLRHYAILRERVSLKLDCPAAGGLLHHLLGGFSAPGATPDEVIEVRGFGPYAVHRNGRFLCDARDVDSLAAGIEWRLVRQALRRAEGVVLHAASLAWKGTVVAFPGASGSGKSTLCLALLASGARLLSDDATPVLHETSSVMPFPRASYVNERSLAALRAFGAAPLLDRPGLLRTLRRDACLSAALLPLADPRPRPLDCVICPSFRPGGTRLSPLSRGQGLIRLARNVMEASRAAFPFPRLADLAQRAAFYELRTDDLRGAVDAASEAAFGVPAAAASA